MLAALLDFSGFRKRWPTLSEDDVRSHNSRRSLWVVSGDSVYDVTDVLQSHPGGSTALLRRGGGAADCSSDYVFHSRYARRQWEARKVGELEPSAAIRLLNRLRISSSSTATDKLCSGPTQSTSASLSIDVGSTKSCAPLGYCDCSQCRQLAA